MHVCVVCVFCGVCVRARRFRYVNKTLSTILSEAGVTSITGAALNATFVAAASASQYSWVTYPWSVSGAAGVFTKRAVVGPAGSRTFASRYYLGIGYNAGEQGGCPVCVSMRRHCCEGYLT